MLSSFKAISKGVGVTLGFSKFSFTEYMLGPVCLQLGPLDWSTKIRGVFVGG